MRQEPSRWAWAENLLRPVLIALMLVCLLAPVVALLERMIGGWQGGYFLAFAFFAGLEGVLSERLLRQRRVTEYGYLTSRASEVLLLLVLLKLIGHLVQGIGPFGAQVQAWVAGQDPFLTPTDAILSILFVAFWIGAQDVARIAMQLDIKEEVPEPPEDKTSVAYYLWLTRPHPQSDRHYVLDSLAERFAWGGIGILLTSALLYALGALERALALPILIYFALGMGLLSQGQFGTLQLRWQMQRLPVQKGIVRRWLLWVSLFVTLIALVSLWLPTLYSIGPLQALLGVLTILINVLSLLYYGLLVLITWPLAHLLPNMETPTPPPTLQPDAMLDPQTAQVAGSAFLETLLSALFWVMLAAVAIYAIVRFFQDRSGWLSRTAADHPWWGRLWAWLRDLWRQWRHWRGEIQSRREQRQRERTAATTEPPARRFLFPGRLPAREQIRYFYLSTVRRAGKAGQARRPSQTPLEYRRSLDLHFPDLEPDLSGLTDAFLKARYSARPLHRDDVHAAKTFWQRLRAALRARFKG